MSISDVDGDLSSTAFVPILSSIDPGYGTFSVNANGDWQFTLDNSSSLVQQLGMTFWHPSDDYAILHRPIG